MCRIALFLCLKLFPCLLLRITWQEGSACCRANCGTLQQSACPKRVLVVPTRAIPFRAPSLSHLYAHLPRRFTVRVRLEGNSNAACMSEYWFVSGPRSHRFLCLAAGTGLGVGIAIDGRPLRFAYECLGDIGHVIVQPNGPLCTCG